MAAIPVTIVGLMSYSGLEVGGGPMPGGPGGPVVMPPIYYPPAQPPSGGQPPGVPTHPIYYPPQVTPPIYYPPGTEPGAPRPEHPIMLPGMPGWGGDLRPSHPIYFPPPPPPEGPPTGDGRWGWVDPPGAWVWVPASPGKPQPIP